MSHSAHSLCFTRVEELLSRYESGSCLGDVLRTRDEVSRYATVNPIGLSSYPWCRLASTIWNSWDSMCELGTEIQYFNEAQRAALVWGACLERDIALERIKKCLDPVHRELFRVRINSTGNFTASNSLSSIGLILESVENSGPSKTYIGEYVVEILPFLIDGFALENLGTVERLANTITEWNIPIELKARVYNVVALWQWKAAGPEAAFPSIAQAIRLADLCEIEVKNQLLILLLSNQATLLAIIGDNLEAIRQMDSVIWMIGTDRFWGVFWYHGRRALAIAMKINRFETYFSGLKGFIRKAIAHDDRTPSLVSLKERIRFLMEVGDCYTDLRKFDTAQRYYRLAKQTIEEFNIWWPHISKEVSWSMMIGTRLAR